MSAEVLHRCPHRCPECGFSASGKKVSVSGLPGLSRLQRGDILRHKGSGNSYVVDSVGADNQVIAVRTVYISNPSEWEKVTVTVLAI